MSRAAVAAGGGRAVPLARPGSFAALRMTGAAGITRGCHPERSEGSRRPTSHRTRDRPFDARPAACHTAFQHPARCSDIRNAGHPEPTTDTTLAKGLVALDWLARRPDGAGVSEASAALGLPRSNAHRTLQTLVACGWAEQDPATARYRASLRLFELGTLQGQALDVAARVRPHLAALAAATGETIHLAVLDGADIVYLDKFDSPLPVVAYSRVGGRAPAACVASGKALLAAQPHDAASLRERLGTLQPHTRNSIVSFEELAAELDLTAARGHAENREEWRLGVCGLGAPLFDARGVPVAAVGMSVPSIRFGRTQARRLAQRLATCARDASVALGLRLAVGHPTST